MDGKPPDDARPGQKRAQGEDVQKRMQDTTARINQHAARMQELTAAMKAAVAGHRDTTPLLRERVALHQEGGKLLREQMDNTLAALSQHAGTPPVYRYRDEDAPTPELREQYRSHLERMKRDVIPLIGNVAPATSERKLLAMDHELLDIQRQDFAASAGQPQRLAYLATEMKDTQFRIDQHEKAAPDKRLPAKPPPSQPARRKGLQLWVVQSGRAQTLHLMRSKNPSTPNPASSGSILAQLLWFGGNGKRTLCGRQATRWVGVFAPREATCRECRRRAGLG